MWSSISRKQRHTAYLRCLVTLDDSKIYGLATIEKLITGGWQPEMNHFGNQAIVMNAMSWFAEIFINPATSPPHLVTNTEWGCFFVLQTVLKNIELVFVSLNLLDKS